MSTKSRSPEGNLVTSEDVHRYQTDGFVAIGRPILTAAEVAPIRVALDQLFDRYASLPGNSGRNIGTLDESGAVPEIVWTTRLHPALKDTPGFRRLRAAAAELLGVPRVRLHFDHAIFKPARSGGKTAWHQDVAFDPDHDCPVATMWLALVDATPDNGCMRFIPGSHTGVIKPHHVFGRHGLEAEEVDEVDAVVCPLPAGGVTVHMQRTLHGSGPNASDRVRAAWILKFIPDERPSWLRAAGAMRDTLMIRRKWWPGYGRESSGPAIH